MLASPAAIAQRFFCPPRGPDAPAIPGSVAALRMVGAAGKSAAPKARKRGASKPELQAWPAVARKPALRRELLHSTHLFTVPEFLSVEECEAFIRSAEARGLQHQSSGGPAKGEAFRDNERLADHNVDLAAALWHAGLRELFDGVVVGRRVAVGLNPNIRLYRYAPGQRFGPHYDESVEVDGGGATEFTLLVYLTGDLSGGETVFYDRRKVVAEVAPAAGMALFHVHGARCLLHEAKSVLKGVNCSCPAWCVVVLFLSDGSGVHTESTAVDHAGWLQRMATTRLQANDHTITSIAVVSNQ